MPLVRTGPTSCSCGKTNGKADYASCLELCAWATGARTPSGLVVLSEASARESGLVLSKRIVAAALGSVLTEFKTDFSSYIRGLNARIHWGP